MARKWIDTITEWARARKVDFRCATKDEIQYWKESSPETDKVISELFGHEKPTRYTGNDWRWGFCIEAYRPRCEELRQAGKCVRRPLEWDALLWWDADIARRGRLKPQSRIDKQSA